MIKKKYRLKRKFSTFLMIYFIIFTSYFSVTTFSKYVGVIKDTATTKVAKWEVSVDTDENASDELNVVIGNTTQSYKVKLTSTSDTKAFYSIILSNLPNSVQVKLDEEDYQYPVDSEIIFSDIGYINANATPENKSIIHTLTFSVPIGSDKIDSNTIDIDIIFNQENPE